MMKTLIFLVALLGLYTVISVMAQSQSQSQTPVSTYRISPGPTTDYKLGSGDILDVRVAGRPDLNSIVEIDADGNISSLPLIETRIAAKCHTEREVQQSLTEVYSKHLAQPHISVRTVERRSRPPATIIGAVFQAKQVPTIRRIRLLELLALSGGVTDRAVDTIRIIHTMTELCPEPSEIAASKTTAASDVGEVQSYKISDLRTAAVDPFIRPGDFVMAVSGDPVFVTGLVIQPQTLIMKDHMTLTEAIARCGGMQRLPRTSAHILRQKDGKIAGQDIKVDYDAIRRGQEKDIVLKPYDIIEVGEPGFHPNNLHDMLMGWPLIAVSKSPIR